MPSAARQKFFFLCSMAQLSKERLTITITRAHVIQLVANRRLTVPRGFLLYFAAFGAGAHPGREARRDPSRLRGRNGVDGRGGLGRVNHRQRRYLGRDGTEGDAAGEEKGPFNGQISHAVPKCIKAVCTLKFYPNGPFGSGKRGTTGMTVQRSIQYNTKDCSTAKNVYNRNDRATVK